VASPPTRRATLPQAQKDLCCTGMSSGLERSDPVGYRVASPTTRRATLFQAQKESRLEKDVERFGAQRHQRKTNSGKHDKIFSGPFCSEKQNFSTNLATNFFGFRKSPTDHVSEHGDNSLKHFCGGESAGILRFSLTSPLKRDCSGSLRMTGGGVGRLSSNGRNSLRRLLSSRSALIHD